MILIVTTLVLITGAASLPPPTDYDYDYQPGPLNSLYDMPQVFNRSRRYIPSHFQHLYVIEGGLVRAFSTDKQLEIEIGGSPRTSDAGVRRAAEIVGKMTRYVPTEIFNNLARSGAGAGVFTWSEKVTIYPNYAGLKNTPECGRSCSGKCAYTCTGDGRKYENLGGLGGKIGAIVEDNVMCGPKDQFYHRESITIHEFSHTLKTYGLPRDLSMKVDRAYTAAKANATWLLQGYGMVSSQEYWAEASQTFMGVSQLSAYNAAGMNACHGNFENFCNEMEGRQRIKSKDPVLYNILVHVWTNGRPNLSLGLNICPYKNRDYK